MKLRPSHLLLLPAFSLLASCGSLSDDAGGYGGFEELEADSAAPVRSGGSSSGRPGTLEDLLQSGQVKEVGGSDLSKIEMPPASIEAPDPLSADEIVPEVRVAGITPNSPIPSIDNTGNPFSPPEPALPEDLEGLALLPPSPEEDLLTLPSSDPLPGLSVPELSVEEALSNLPSASEIAAAPRGLPAEIGGAQVAEDLLALPGENRRNVTPVLKEESGLEPVEEKKGGGPIRLDSSGRKSAPKGAASMSRMHRIF